ncbi:DUF58 domain-containing protein [Cellulosimicrobium sp. CpK407]|uniref:DUF58 domain-containing protein n=1 Tax=Cellulosimicrobium sp. CpK407 TaxID=3229847 RepID=UPI003F36C9B8
MALTWRAVVLTALGIVPVLLFPVPGTVLVWTLLVVALCALDASLAASPRRVAIERRVPGSVRLTDTTTSRLTLTNLAPRRLRALVRDAWPPSAGTQVNRHPVDLPPGEATRVTTVLVPTRRGERVADRVTIRSFGPLRLAARQASITVPGRLRVLPEFASRRHLPSRLARLREMDGRAAVQVRGEGTEFDSLREYVLGDDVRSIDWRASARGRDMVVRTWRPERDRRVLIVVDTSRTSATRVGDEPRLDASIEAALLLAALAGRAGDRVELVAYDRTVRSRVAGAAGPRLMPAMADALAPLEPALLETDWPGLVGTVHERLSQRALVVLLSTLDPAAVETGLLPVVGQLTAKHQVVLAAAGDPEVAALRADRSGTAEAYDAAAAARGEIERAAVTTVLRQRGVEVVDALPGDLAPRLADTYLALKAAGRL